MDESSKASGEKKRIVEIKDEATSPQTKRGRPSLDSNGSVYSPSGKKNDVDHTQVLAYAAKNNRSRFYIPQKDNFIGEIQYERVLIDCGCSSILLPFPGNGLILKEKYLDRRSFYWEIFKSKGTGAVHSPVLKIKALMIGSGFPCVLAGNEQPRVAYLRFHLGSEAAQHILNDEEMKGMLQPQHLETLFAFTAQLTVLGADVAPERKHVLLGQLYLEHVLYCQAGPIALMMKTPFEGNLRHYFGVYRSIVKPKVEDFDGFHDLEDDDHDAETDEEEHPVAWDDDDDNDDEIDEYDR